MVKVRAGVLPGEHAAGQSMVDFGALPHWQRNTLWLCIPQGERTRKQAAAERALADDAADDGALVPVSAG